MNTKQKERFQDLLAEMSVRLRGDVDSLTEQSQNPSGGHGAGEITNVPHHLGDMGTDEYLQGLNNTLLENEEYVAEEVHSALDRLEDGTFGICEACGEQISEERLEAIPYARYCVTCAERLDPIFIANYNSGRPASPRDTLSYDRRAASETNSNSTDGQIPIRKAVDHAVGTPGGGSAVGGIAGTTHGHGDPDENELLGSTMGSGEFDADEDRPIVPNTSEVLG
jgi:RNA polymerase-binding transcription factor DksA